MNYQLVIQFPILDASAEDFDRLIWIENELGLVLGEHHDVDGHDMGSGEMNIFIHTDDPKKAFELAKNVLSEKDLDEVSAAFRSFNSDEFSWLWPENTKEEFIVH